MVELFRELSLVLHHVEENEEGIRNTQWGFLPTLIWNFIPTPCLIILQAGNCGLDLIYGEISIKKASWVRLGGL